MKELGISIIIPSHNSGDYLLEMIGSIEKLKHTINYEIIVIDDGSTDKISIDAIKKINDSDNYILLINETCKGSQYSRNKGIRASKYDYLMACDADDMFSNKFDGISYMSKAVKLLEKNNNLAFVQCTTEMIGDFKGYTVSAYPVNSKQILMKHHAPLSIVYRKSDLSSLLYDEDIKKWQEWSFAVSILNERFKKGLKNEIKFIDTPYYNYRIHTPTTSIRISGRDHSEADMVKITVKKNKEIYQNLFPKKSLDYIAKKVIENKPNRLVDLLYIASYNLERAIQIAKEREADIISSAPPSVP